MSGLIRTVGLCALALFSASAGELSPSSAKEVFRLARDLARKDAGQLWGRSLEGPLILVDPKTLKVVANQADRDGLLEAQEGCFTGSLPPGVTFANTAKEWAGVRWTMVMWSDFDQADPKRLGDLLMHESFHRIQNDLGLGRGEAPCGHLDSEAGRTWLRLELRALAKALSSSGEARAEAFRDALAFRAERHRLLPGAKKSEGPLEMNEGLATYTGLSLAYERKEAETKAAKDIRNADGHPRFARSFAYASGPAYAFLLDDVAPGWRTRAAQAQCLSELFPETWQKVDPGRAEKAAAPYGAEEIRTLERRTAIARAARVAAIRKQYQDAPVLSLPGPFHLSFSPHAMESVEGLGVHYVGIKAEGDWGHLNAPAGGLRSEDWNKLTLTAPSDPSRRPVKGPGYELVLKDGWELAPGARPGDWTLRRKP